MYEDPLTILARVASRSPELQSAVQQSNGFSSTAAVAPIEPKRRDGAPLLHAQMRMADAGLLSYGQILLKRFKDVVIANSVGLRFTIYTRTLMFTPPYPPSSGWPGRTL